MSDTLSNSFHVKNSFLLYSCQNGKFSRIAFRLQHGIQKLSLEIQTNEISSGLALSS